MGYQLLSINQLGAVYESLLSYRGFFAKAQGFYRRVFYAFDGLCYRKRTGCNYAGGALDIYSGGTINLGYAY